jgi:hypothetical protein
MSPTKIRPPGKANAGNLRKRNAEADNKGNGERRVASHGRERDLTQYPHKPVEDHRRKTLDHQ